MSAKWLLPGRTCECCAYCVIFVSSPGCRAGHHAGNDTGVMYETAAINAEANAWFKAIAAKDLDKTLSFYAPDAQYMSAGRVSAATPDARRKAWIDDYSLPGFFSDETTTQVEVARSFDLAYQRGTYVSGAQDTQGHAIQSTGKFVVVWKKLDDGRWKAIIDIDNADQ